MAKVLELQLQHGPSNEYSGLISLRTDYFDLPVQGNLTRLLQHHKSKALVLQPSAFFMVQLWHLYMTTGKTIALNTWTFAGKVMSLLFNTLSRFIIAFLPRSKCLNFLAAVTMHSDFRDQENKICRCLHFSVIYLPWSDGTGSEKSMATHSSTLAWKIPWTGEPGRLQSVGSHRVGHDWSDLAAAAAAAEVARHWILLQGLVENGHSTNSR